MDETNQIKDEKNPFFNPVLFKIIEEKLYIAPFWSAIAINTISHLTNNPVEKWFDIVKNDILVNNKNSHVQKAMPSELTSLVYTDSLYKYNLLFKNDIPVNFASEKLNNEEPKENWSDSHKKKDNKRKKGFFFKSDPNFGMNFNKNKKLKCVQESQNIHFKDSFKLGLFSFNIYAVKKR